VAISAANRNKEVPLRLHSLLRQSGIEFNLLAPTDVTVGGVTDDSRRVRPGDLFVARPGAATDGSAFARDAVTRGAAAIVSQQTIDGLNVPVVVTPDAAAATSHLACAFAGDPSATVKVLAVTGTNGKTTTAYLIRHILNHVQQTCGMVGTVQIDDGQRQIEAAMTTPGACEVAELLARMKANGCRACAIEASSHALAQSRLAGVKLAGAAFTNLTLDHLDYHKTMTEYATAKARLFAQLPAGGVAAINADDRHHTRMIERCDGRIVTFGMRESADYRAVDIAATAAGTSFILHSPDGQTEIHLRLIGRHNVENALAALTLCCEAMGVSIHQAAAALRTAEGAPGRLQAVRAGQPFAVLVDYAHTDDALQNVLTALRPLVRGRLRLVFGCGGDRDASKRPRMARIAQQHADCVYLTSDNPRTEDPQSILGDVVAGFSLENTKPITVQPDRRAAIEQAIAEAEAGDLVLIAGKGHENCQILGKTKHHFDDVEEATRAITVAARA
jgi:UDP-N-acetylmuramoyl-L-alanyl-D-glutamate--2,6-diaminopimelate ligase